MIRKFCLLLGCFLFTFSLAAQEVSSYMVKNLIRVKSVIVDDAGKEYTIFGGGFIVNTKYLATVYTNYKPKGFKKKPKRMVVYYNYGVDEKNNLKWDSVDIDLLYKYIPGKQYDFSKHIYNEDKLETDFIVLKLKKAIPVKKQPYNTEFSLHKYKLMPTMAFDNSTGALRNDTLHYLFPQFYNNVKETYQLVLFGPSRMGFSGTPIFNLNGEIVAMLQFGMGELNEVYITSLNKAGFLTDEDVVGIRRGYLGLDPRYFIFATNIKYYLDKYLKGFK